MKHEELTLTGLWEAVCENPDGSVAWVELIHNSIVDQGLTDLLGVYFGAGTQKTNWYVGLIDAAGFSALAASDTMSSHPGWVENTAYSQSTRGQWSPAVASDVASNTVGVPFTMSAGATIQGLFLASSSAKGGTSGVLWSTALFGLPRALAAGQTIRLTYTLRAAGGG